MLSTIITHWLHICDFDDTLTNELLLLTLFSHYVVTIMFFALYCYSPTKQIYWSLLTWGAFPLMYGINMTLQIVINETAPNPTCGYSWNVCGENCTTTSLFSKDPNCYPCASPSLEVQMVSYFVTMCFTYCCFWKFEPEDIESLNEPWHSPKRIWYTIRKHGLIAGLMTWLFVTIVAHVYLGFGSPSHAVLGAMVGTIFGISYSWVAYLYIYRHLETINSRSWSNVYVKVWISWFLAFFRYSTSGFDQYEVQLGDPVEVKKK